MVSEGSKGASGEKAAIVWLPQAIDDVERITAAIAVHSPNAALRAKALIWDHVQLIGRFPQLAKLLPDGVNRMWHAKIGASAIHICYRITSDKTVVIQHVRYGREMK